MNKLIDNAIKSALQKIDGTNNVKIDGPWFTWTAKDGKSYYASRRDLIEELHIDCK